MMYGQNKAAAQYRVVRSHGLVADASPTRLVQIMFEHILSQLTTARGCMERIKDNRPLNEVTAKVTAIAKAMALIGQLNGTLDMERGGEVAKNLRALYEYMLNRLTLANATNDPGLVAEVAGLVAEIKIGWDQIVTDLTMSREPRRGAGTRDRAVAASCWPRPINPTCRRWHGSTRERLRLLQSVRLERSNLSDGDRLVLQTVAELNDRAIGLMEHQRRSTERELDLAAVGRRAVAAYSTTRPQR